MVCDMVCDIWYDMLVCLLGRTPLSVRNLIWYDVIWYMIWFDMMWYDMIRYMIWCDII
jgi:hypothetical protein